MKAQLESTPHVGVAESAMREVKRQTRTLKFALEGACGERSWSPIPS